MAQTTNNAHETLDGARLWGLVDVTGPEVKMWRGANIATDYADARVMVYDHGGASAAPVYSAAAAMADGVANPTVGSVGVNLRGYNGATWDRIRSGVQADVAAATGYLATLGVAQYNATFPTVTDTRYNHLQVGLRGSLRVEIAQPNGGSSQGWIGAAADATSNTLAAMTSAAFNYSYNGSTWDRVRSATGLGDAQNGAGSVAVGNYGYNGSTWDRFRAGVSSSTALTGFQNVINPDITASGTLGALNAEVLLTAPGAGAIAVDVRGTFSATLAVQATFDGTNWFTLYGGRDPAQATSGSFATMSTAGQAMFGGVGASQYRVRMTAYTSGTAVVTVRGTRNQYHVRLNDVQNQTAGGSDGISSQNGLTTLAYLYGYNGASTDRLRSYGTGILATVEKPVADANAGPTQHKDWGAATKANIKASAGNAWSFIVTNANAAVRFFQLHNKASAPAGTDVPLCSYPVPAGTANNPGTLILTKDHLQGLRFGTGIGWAISTTIGTFTDAATAADHSVEVMYA